MYLGCFYIFLFNFNYLAVYTLLLSVYILYCTVYAVCYRFTYVYYLALTLAHSHWNTDIDIGMETWLYIETPILTHRPWHTGIVQSKLVVIGIDCFVCFRFCCLPLKVIQRHIWILTHQLLMNCATVKYAS